MWVLALKNLIHDRVRLAITLTGITFSVALILIQVGMIYGMTANSSTLKFLKLRDLRVLRGEKILTLQRGESKTLRDIWIIADNSQNFDMVNPFPETLVTAARSVPLKLGMKVDLKIQ